MNIELFSKHALIDIDDAQLSKDFLSNIIPYMLYKDMEMEEHIYSIDELYEDEDLLVYNNEILAIKQLCDTEKAAYFRIVKL